MTAKPGVHKFNPLETLHLPRRLPRKSRGPGATPCRHRMARATGGPQEPDSGPFLAPRCHKAAGGEAARWDFDVSTACKTRTVLPRPRLILGVRRPDFKVLLYAPRSHALLPWISFASIRQGTDTASRYSGSPSAATHRHRHFLSCGGGLGAGTQEVIAAIPAIPADRRTNCRKSP
jgi:hypothetical protein